MTSSARPSVPLVERSILSLMIRDAGFRRRALGDGLKAEQFYELRHVFDAVLAMSRDGIAIDVATLAAWLDRKGQLGGIQSGPVSGAAAIDDIARHEPTPDNWSQWLQELRRVHSLRVGQDVGQWILEASTPEEVLEATKAGEKAVKEAMSGPSRSKTAREAMQILAQWMTDTRSAGRMPGLDTGMPDLNSATGGIRKAQLWTILAETSGGKSVLMQQYAVEAIAQGKRVAIFSIEMQVYEVAARMVSRHGKIELGKFLNPAETNKREFEVMKAQMQMVANTLFTIDDTPAMTLAHIEAECLRLKDAHGSLDLVIVDYLQIVKAERQKGQNREEAVAGVSGGLKQLAKLLDCPVITGSQINKEGKSRESEAIVFDSDVSLMICGDGIIITKNRNGPKNITLRYELVGALQSFVPFNPEQRTAAQEEADRKADEEAARQKGRKGSSKSGKDHQCRG